MAILGKKQVIYDPLNQRCEFHRDPVPAAKFRGSFLAMASMGLPESIRARWLYTGKAKISL
jgi:hypothetical protein